MERDGTEMVAMQPAGKLGEERVLRIRGNAFNNELLPGDPERNRCATLEEMLGTARHTRRGRRERRVPLRIHGVLVQRDGQLDEKIGQLSRESGLFGRRSPGHGSPK